MPVSKTKTIWPTRVSWPRRQEGAAVLPALVGQNSAAPLPYVTGRSRFAIAPLSLSLDQLLLLIVSALLCFGLVMVQSADLRVRGVNDHWMLAAFSNKNAIHAGVALLLMAAVWRIDYRWLLGKSMARSPAVWFLLVTVLSLGAVLAVGSTLNGAKRWLMIPIGITKLSVQPSELAKWGLVIFLAAYTTHMGEKVRSLFRGFAPMILAMGIVCALIVKEDFGTTALIALVAFCLITMAGTKWWHIGLIIPPALAVVYVAVWHSAYRRERLLAFMHPEADPQGAGYHPLQSLLTIISGGFWGLGLGNGIQKMGYLPEGNTDFIFSVLCEELGFIGAGMVIGLFVAFVFVGWRVASRCDNMFGKMIAFGITATVGLQAAINIAVVTVTVPTKGIALPFISSGGTGWILTAGAVGLLMAIERHNRLGIVGEQAMEAQGFPVELSPPEATALQAPISDVQGGGV